MIIDAENLTVEYAWTLKAKVTLTGYDGFMTKIDTDRGEVTTIRLTDDRPRMVNRRVWSMSECHIDAEARTISVTVGELKSSTVDK